MEIKQKNKLLAIFSTLDNKNDFENLEKITFETDNAKKIINNLIINNLNNLASFEMEPVDLIEIIKKFLNYFEAKELQAKKEIEFLKIRLILAKMKKEGANNK